MDAPYTLGSRMAIGNKFEKSKIVTKNQMLRRITWIIWVGLPDA